MPGRAASGTLKRREAHARQRALMSKAVAAYRAELAKPVAERVGARTICARFTKQHWEATGERIPLSRSTLTRHAEGGTTIEDESIPVKSPSAGNRPEPPDAPSNRPQPRGCAWTRLNPARGL